MKKALVILVFCASACGSFESDFAPPPVDVAGELLVVDYATAEGFVDYRGEFYAFDGFRPVPIESCSATDAVEFAERLLPRGTAVRRQYDDEGRPFFETSSGVEPRFELVLAGYGLAGDCGIDHLVAAEEYARTVEVGVWEPCFAPNQDPVDTCSVGEGG